jgi:type II secretory pathway component PulC
MAFTVAVTLLAYDSRSLAQQSEEASAETGADASTGDSESQADAQVPAYDNATAQSDDQSSANNDSTESDTEATTRNDADNGAVPPPANNENETSDTEGTPPTNDANNGQSTENDKPPSQAPSSSDDVNANQAREQSKFKQDQQPTPQDARASAQSRANADSRAGRDRRGDIRVGIQFGRVTNRGLTVNRIERNSFYYDSGFRQGDIIVSINGRPIRSDAEFIRLIVPGQRLPVVVLRNGRRETLYIQYTEIAHSHPGDNNRQYQGGAYLGVTFDAQVRDAAVVLGVNPGSPAQEAGLQAGDLILALNGTEVRAYPDAIAMIRAMRPGDELEIIVERARAERQIVAMLDAPPSARTAARPEVQIERRTITEQPADVRIDVNRQYYNDRGSDRERDYDNNRGRSRLPRLRN